MCKERWNQVPAQRERVVQSGARVQCRRGWRCGQHGNERLWLLFLHNDTQLGRELGAETETGGAAARFPADPERQHQVDVQQRCSEVVAFRVYL